MAKRINNAGANDLEIGKLPPQAPDLEEAVLGAIMISAKCFKDVSGILSADDFYVEANAEIFRAFQDLNDKGNPIDILTVVNKLKERGKLDVVGGAFYVTSLTNKVSSSLNVEFHSRIIIQKSMLRKVIRLNIQIASACYEPDADPFDIIASQKTLLSTIEVFDDEDYSPKTRMKETVAAIEKASKNDGMAGTPTGIKKLDKFTGGITPGDYYVFSARSGSFKTALMIWIQHQVDVFGHPTLMFQQEMTKTQLGLREIALKSGLSTQDLRRGRITNEEYSTFNKAIGKIESSSVYIDTSVGQTIQSIRAKTQRAIDEYGIKFIVIDYLNLCNLEVKKHGTEEAAIANHCKEMKSLAKELNIAVLELVQFNKEASKEPLKPPTMAMLKGSGAIEFSADFIGLFWNPSKFEEGFEYEGVSTKDKIAIIVAKNKNGDTGMFWHGVKASSNEFFELEDNEYFPDSRIEPNLDFDNNSEQPSIYVG